MRIVFTGGGTGGHVVPNLAVINELTKSKQEIEILYIGSKNGVSESLVSKCGINFKGIHCGKLRRYFSLQNLLDIFKVPIGIAEAYKCLKTFKPDIVFSKGGYVSFPVVLAAAKLNIPVILHESDVVPGLANKIMAKFSKKICVSFEETKKYFHDHADKIVVTGNPVRKEVLKGGIQKGYKLTGFKRTKAVLLVIGGSQGARQINDLIRASLDELLKKFQIVHIRGKGNLDISIKKNGYKQFEYLHEEMKDVYAISDLIVSRGGANSLFEIANLKKKAVIIPLATDASRGDQIENAKVFANKIGWSVLSGDIKVEDFISTIKLAHKNSINKKFKIVNAVRPLSELILKLVK